MKKKLSVRGEKGGRASGLVAGLHNPVLQLLGFHRLFLCTQSRTNVPALLFPRITEVALCDKRQITVPLNSLLTAFVLLPLQFLQLPQISDQNRATRCLCCEQKHTLL